MTVITSTSPIGDLIFSLVLECALLLCLVHDPNHPKINTAIRTCETKTMYHNFILVTLYLLEPFNTAIRTCETKTMNHNFILVTLYLLEPFNTAIRTCETKTMYHNFILVTLYLLEPFNDQTPLSCFGSNLPGWPCSNNSDFL